MITVTRQSQADQVRAARATLRQLAAILAQVRHLLASGESGWPVLTSQLDALEATLGAVIDDCTAAGLVAHEAAVAEPVRVPKCKLSVADATAIRRAWAVCGLPQAEFLRMRQRLLAAKGVQVHVQTVWDVIAGESWTARSA